MMGFRAPAAVAALLKKRRREKLRQEAMRRDFPDDEPEVVMQGSLLFEAAECDEQLFERRLVLNADYFQILSGEGEEKMVPMTRVLGAAATNDSGMLFLSGKGAYSWRSGDGAGKQDFGGGSVDQVTSKSNTGAAKFAVRTHSLHEYTDEPQEKSYTFVCSTMDLRDQWLAAFERVVADFRAKPQQTQLESVRSQLRDAYFCEPFQITVAGFILLNFMCMAAEAQLNPTPGTSAADAFETIEVFFTVVFCIELGLNMFANLFWNFVSSGWNWFDVFVISTAVISLTGLVDTGGLVHLRLLRAFRVLRFFNRIPSLQKIVVALYASIPAMSNAMALTFMVLAMYSVMAVTFFRETGEEYFGTFGRALFTLFQFSTGDGWSDVVRAIPYETDVDGISVSIFFVSFMIIVSIVLMQVVIAGGLASRKLL